MFKKLLGKLVANKTTPSTTGQVNTVEGYLFPLTAKQLLATELRQALINHIWQHTSLSREQFQRMYLNPIENYAALVQQFPASESHHHAYLGGLLDHGLELVGHALKYRQNYLLPPGVPPEDQAVQADAWTAAIAYAGLLHDLGKIAVDIEVQLQDSTQWHPWHGTISQAYRFRYLPKRDYQLHDKAVGLLCRQIIEPDILNWLCHYKELWSNFLNLMAGHYEQAGILGEIVDKADRISTAKNIGANPEKAIAAPVNSLQKKLITGLRHLVKTQLTLNKTPGDGWLTQDGLWLMSKTTADQLRAYLLSQGFDGIPTKNSVLFDELQSYQIIQANPLDDRAIWTVAVADAQGSWQQQFSLIKVNPALLWSHSERPEVFTGQISVIQKENAQGLDNLSVEAVQQLSTNKSALDILSSVSESLEDITSATTISTSATKVFNLNTAENDDTDDVLSLFADELAFNTNTATTSQPLSTTSPRLKANEPAIEREESVSFINTTVASVAPLDSTTTETSFTTDDHRLNFDLTVTINKTTLGEYFISWLKHRISHHKLQVNDKDAKLHLVNEQLFIVSPGIFQRFYHEHPELIKLMKDKQKEPWRVIQSSFEKLKYHVKRADDLNIWQCTVTGPRKKGQVIKGYLLNARLFFTDFIPSNNPFVTLQNGDEV